MSKLIINGQEIDSFKEESGLDLGDDVVVYELPDHMLLDKKQSLKWIGDFSDIEVEAMQRILGIDLDQMVNKKVRVILQSLGPARKKE